MSTVCTAALASSAVHMLAVTLPLRSVHTSSAVAAVFRMCITLTAFPMMECSQFRVQRKTSVISGRTAIPPTVPPGSRVLLPTVQEHEQLPHRQRGGHLGD